MTELDIYKIFKNQFPTNSLVSNNKIRLFVVLGLLGDLDSFEYVQSLVRKSNFLISKNISLFVVGVGTDESKKKFCDFTGIPSKNIEVLADSSFHNELAISRGCQLTKSAIFNLLLMCCGIGSPGTLKEVFRGYMGDKMSENIFKKNEFIKLGKDLRLNASLFSRVGSDFQRPFELASLRLMNLLEIISHWDLYMSDASLLTLRNATFLLNENNKLIYDFLSYGLLRYSKNPSDPLDFLDGLP